MEGSTCGPIWGIFLDRLRKTAKISVGIDGLRYVPKWTQERRSSVPVYTPSTAWTGWRSQWRSSFRLAACSSDKDRSRSSRMQTRLTASVSQLPNEVIRTDILSKRRPQWPRSLKAWTVSARSNNGIVGSNPTWGMEVCVRLFCVWAVLCASSGLATADPPFKESNRLRNRSWTKKKWPRSNKGL
jgi:hypothetical protein